MRKLLRNRMALSTVVTTLIILVVSVLLAGVVTYFAINVTSTRVQEENLQLTYQHIWYDPTNNTGAGSCVGALMIINTGGRDVVIQKLTVRGQTVDWSNVAYNITTTAQGADLPYNTTVAAAGAANDQTIGGKTFSLTVATTEVTLKSGMTMIIYMANPDSISVNDIGLTVAITVFTSQAMYYKETNVEATS